MATPVLDVAILWKIQYILDVSRGLGEGLQKAASQPGGAGEVHRLAQQIGKLDRDMTEVLGADKGKAWDAVKANLQDAIDRQERNLADGTHRSGEGRAAIQRDIDQLKKAVEGLDEEGRP